MEKGDALGRELLTLLQLPYNSSSEISSHHQYVGSQLEILTSLGSCYSRQDPALGLGVMGPLCSPRCPRLLQEALSLAPPAPFPASDGYLRDTASLADPGNILWGLPDFYPHCGAVTHWATSSSMGLYLSRIVSLFQIS